MFVNHRSGRLLDQPGTTLVPPSISQVFSDCYDLQSDRQSVDYSWACLSSRPPRTSKSRVMHRSSSGMPPWYTCFGKGSRMRDFLIAFVMCFIGSMAIGPLTAALQRWADKRFPPLPPLSPSYEIDPAQAFPKARVLRIAVSCLFLTWASLIALVSVLILAPIGVLSDVRSLVIAVNTVFLSVGALFIFFAFSIRCPKCMRHLLFQPTEQPTPAEKTKWINGWVIALKAARNHNFRCMHCGQRFFMKPDTLRSAANA
jgi:hypothetical protein